MPAGRLQLAFCHASGVSRQHGPHGPLFREISHLRKAPHMTDIGSRAPRRRPGYAWLAAGPLAAAGAIAMFIAAQPAVAATAPALGTAGSFAVLAGTPHVTNTGRSIISGDLGVSPAAAVTGFPPGHVINGTIHRADAVAAQAQSDLTIAYNDAAGGSGTAITAFIGAGQTL